MVADSYDPLPALIDFATRLRFEDLPEQTVREVKRHAIDAIACALGGLSDERLRQRWAYVSARPIAYDAGGLAYGAKQKLSLTDAAFLNSTMTRWLDFNDTYLALEPAHPSDNFGLLFALSGMCGLSGGDLILAAVLAYDIQCRFAEAASLRAHGWDHVNYILISAALAGARLLGFDHDQMYNAVALSLSSHAAMRQAREGTYLSEQKNMAAADAVRGAAWALEKVLAGANGPAEIIDGKHGFIAQISGPLNADAFEGLGERFFIDGTYIKQYPVEYHAQTVVEHALNIREQLATPRLADVEGVVLSGYEAQRTIIGDDSKRVPATKETADHSVYYAFAAPLVAGKMTLEQYRPEMLADPGVMALIRRTSFKEVPDWTEKYFAPEAEREFISSARVQLRDGRVAEHLLHHPHGHPKNPMSDREIEDKFASLSQPFLKGGSEVLDMLWNLEHVSNVGDLVSSISITGEGLGQ
jgi:2-methylcitrate dehydratase